MKNNYCINAITYIQKLDLFLLFAGLRTLQSCVVNIMQQ